LGNERGSKLQAQALEDKISLRRPERDDKGHRAESDTAAVSGNVWKGQRLTDQNESGECSPGVFCVRNEKEKGIDFNGDSPFPTGGS